jgi:hypothetical protein
MVNGSNVVDAMMDIRRAMELDPEEALSVLSGAEVDSDLPVEHLRRVASAMRWLGPPEPDDLEQILAALRSALCWPDPEERLVELVVLEASLQRRADDAVPGADVAHAAVIDMLITLATGAEGHGHAADNGTMREFRERMEATRLATGGNAEFEEEVERLKARLAAAPPSSEPRPGTTT